MSAGWEPTPYEVLRHRLMELRLRAGNPSYRQMGALWKGHPACGGRGGLVVFAAGTIADNLNGKRQAMSAPFVRFFVLSCLAYAQQTGIELPAQYLTKGLWNDWWAAQALSCEHDQAAAQNAPDHRPSAVLADLAQRTPSAKGAGHTSGHDAHMSRHHESGRAEDSHRTLPPSGVICERVTRHRGLLNFRDLLHSGRRGLTPWGESFTPADPPPYEVRPIQGSGGELPVPDWFPEVMQVCAQIVDSDPVLRQRVGSSQTLTRAHGRGRCARGSLGWTATNPAGGE